MALFLINTTVRDTQSLTHFADDAGVAPFIGNTKVRLGIGRRFDELICAVQLAHRVVILPQKSDHTNGVKRLSEERQLGLEGCVF
jgi:hypothetical protein